MGLKESSPIVIVVLVLVIFSLSFKTHTKTIHIITRKQDTRQNEPQQHASLQKGALNTGNTDR